MAQITKSGNGLLITSTSTDNDVLHLSSFMGDKWAPNKEFTATIEIIDGDFQFNVGDACTSDNATLITGAKNIMAFGNAHGDINIKASAVDKTFEIFIV